MGTVKEPEKKDLETDHELSSHGVKLWIQTLKKLSEGKVSNIFHSIRGKSKGSKIYRAKFNTLKSESDQTNVAMGFSRKI